MITWAYIYEHPGTDPVTDRHVIERDGQRTLLVPVPDPSVAPQVAERLIADGARLIELCGGFSAVDAAAVTTAVAGRVPVGHVTFAVDAAAGVVAYGQAFEAATGG